MVESKSKPASLASDVTTNRKQSRHIMLSAKDRANYHKSILGATGRNDLKLLETLLTTSRCLPQDELSKALHRAAELGWIECLKLLLSHGAHPDVHDDNGFTALIVASKMNNVDIVKELIDRRCKVDKVTYRVRATALHWASSYGHYDCVDLLLRAKCKVEPRTIHRRTPLMMASRSGHEDVCDLLMRYGADVNTFDLSKTTALHYASGEDSTDCVTLLLRAGAQVNARTNTGATALLLAAGGGHLQAMKILLRQPKLDTSLCCHYLTVMHKAVESCDRCCVELLLEYSVDSDTPTASRYCGMDAMVHQGLTPLMIACSLGHVTITKLLLDDGANLKARDEEGRTPMYLAIKHDHQECLQLLLTRGVNINSFVDQENNDQNDDKPPVMHYQESPIAVAIKENAVRCLYVLLSQGCDTDVLIDARTGVRMSLLELSMSEKQASSCLMVLHGRPPPIIINKAVFQEGMAWLAQTNEHIYYKFIDRLHNVQNLSELCRWVIRHKVKGCVCTGISYLPVPPKIKAFLNLQELQIYYL